MLMCVDRQEGRGGGKYAYLGCICKAHAQVAGKLLADCEAEAVRRHPIGALVESKWWHEAGRWNHTRNPTLLSLQRNAHSSGHQEKCTPP